MNNDSTPIQAVADLPTIPQHESRSSDPTVDTAAESSQRENGNAPTVAQKRVKIQTKKYEFVNAIMFNLDILIYAELCIVYYMDCSFFRLLIRALAQVIFLTPKPNFITPIPKNRPYISAIFGPNVICILLHIFTARSEAGEAMRGYLHGGIIIDLIGQRGPTSKIHLVLLDLLVIALQCFMLAVHMERERLAASLLPSEEGSRSTVGVVSAQDHDAEERGVTRDVARDNGDMEMQPIRPTIDENNADQERESLLAEPLPREDRDEDEYPLDIFYSGTSVVADFHVIHTLRNQWNDYESATASALQTVGFTSEFAADRRIRRV